MSTEQIEFNDDGTIVATFGDGTYTLRRPNLGEYRELRVGASALSEGLDEFEADVRDKEYADRTVKWWRHAFDVLATALPAETDSWPVWLTDGAPYTVAGDASAHTLMGDVLRHWRAVPLVRGTTG